MTTLRSLALFVFFLIQMPFGLTQEAPLSQAACQDALWSPVGVPVQSPDAGLVGVDKSKIWYTLALSGGGYRAMLFHLGTLRRLNDARLLPKIHIISSVSGGSITAAVLASRWDQLVFDDTGFARNLHDVVEQPVMDLASETIGLPSVLSGLLPFTSAPEVLSGKLDTILFTSVSKKRLRLADIGIVHGQENPRPVFIFLATNLQTGELVQFRSDVVGGPQIGWTSSGDLALADAVVASAGFPPFFAPLMLDLSQSTRTWIDCRENNDNPFAVDPQNEPTRSIDKNDLSQVRAKLYLADGGIRDNLGVSAIEEINRVRRIRMKNLFPGSSDFRTVNLISDGGAATALDIQPSSNWFGVFSRVTSLMSDQPNDLRVENIIRSGARNTLDGTNYSNFARNPCDEKNKLTLADREITIREYLSSQFGDSYAYWSIRRLAKIHVGMRCPVKENSEWMRKEVRALASIPTNLAALNPSLQARLVNWGYLAAHHGMPYISSFITEPGTLRSFIEACKIPFSAKEIDPEADSQSAHAVECLEYQDWFVPYSSR
jgi:NTE family protein